MSRMHDRSKTVKGILLMLALLFISLMVSHLLLVHTGYTYGGVENALWVSRLLFWLSTLIIYLYAIKIEKQSFLLIREQKHNTGFYTLSVIVLVVASFATALIAGIMLKATGLYSSQSKVYTVLTKVLAGNKLLFFFSILTAGIVEELIFRAYLFSRLQIIFKKKYLPVIISSVLFGLVHIGYGTLQNAIIPVFFGILYALYYDRYKSIVPVIIAHSLYDFLLILLSFHFHHLVNK